MLCFFNWYRDDKLAIFVLDGLGLDVATMILRNLATQVESDSGSHACGLGGEERVEDFLKDGWLDADAVVVNADAYRRSWCATKEWFPLP